jgi:hypothetical protein
VQVGVFNVDENKRAFVFDRKTDSKITLAQGEEQHQLKKGGGRER